MFETDGYVKVSDYGLAKNLKPNEKTYSLAGTPDYVSKFVYNLKVHKSSLIRVKASQQIGGLLEF